MATNTYVALDKVTLGSNQASVTLSSIPSTYTDLILVFNGSNSAGNDAYLMYMNGDTSALYSATYLEGDGSTAYSSRWSSRNDIPVARGASSTAGADMLIIQFQNYANTSVNKTILSRYSLGGTTGARTSATVGLYRSTSALNSISIKGSSGNIVAGSTFSLYGVAAEGATAKATGGQITSDANYWYHTFVSSGTFTPTQSLTADYLVVAGGGSGGSYAGGGGGAGGLRSTVTATGGGGSLETALSLTAQAYTVTIGAGGAAVNNTTTAKAGIQGNNSVFSTITATGGGGGGSYANISPTTGGSGGGSPGYSAGASVTGAAGTTNEGYAGGSATSALAGAGGGGSGAVGATVSASSTVGGAGGAGVAVSITGTSVTYAGGGGGAGLSGGAGGSGGGGTAGNGTNTPGTSGTVNTGGGGGGVRDSTDTRVVVSGAGGSGIVIVRYAR